VPKLSLGEDFIFKITRYFGSWVFHVTFFGCKDKWTLVSFKLCTAWRNGTRYKHGLIVFNMLMWQLQSLQLLTPSIWNYASDEFNISYSLVTLQHILFGALTLFSV